MVEICKGFASDNTKKNTEWAVHIFCEWRFYRNKATAVHVTEEMCLVDLLEHPKPSLLNHRNCPNFMNKRTPPLKNSPTLYRCITEKTVSQGLEPLLSTHQ